MIYAQFIGFTSSFEDIKYILQPEKFQAEEFSTDDEKIEQD